MPFALVLSLLLLQSVAPAEHARPEELFPGVWVTGPVPRPNSERNWRFIAVSGQVGVDRNQAVSGDGSFAAQLDGALASIRPEAGTRLNRALLREPYS